jgi:hypothetical protein
MIKAYLPFCFHVLRFSALLSIVSTLISSVIALNGLSANQILYLFIISFLSGGFLLGFLRFELGHNRDYYFYYNLGITKPKLILFAYSIHILVCVVILIVINYAKQI